MDADSYAKTALW